MEETKEKTAKTLQDCKDEAAVLYGYKSIDEIFTLLGEHQIKEARYSQLFSCLDKAYEIYSSHLQKTISRYSNQEVQLSNYAYQMDMAKRERDKAEQSKSELLEAIVNAQVNANNIEDIHQAFGFLQSSINQAISKATEQS